MADAKISALTNLTAADPTNDMIPIVDVSDTPPASGNTKRISINNILSSSPTASGALTVTGLVTAGSATITGAATVGTTLGVTGNLTVLSTGLIVNTTGVGIGVTPTNDLHVKGASGTTTIKIEAVTDGSIGFIGSASGMISGSPANNLAIRAEHGLYLSGNGNATQFILNSAGNVTVSNGNVILGTSGKGIDFSATASGSGTMTSELLNDYEEGTWTPVVTAVTGTLTSVTGQVGRYTKIGRMVTATGFFTITTNGTGGSAVALAGLPFANGDLANIGVGRVDGTTGNMFQVKINASASTANIWKYDNTYPASDGAQFPMTLVYYV